MDESRLIVYLMTFGATAAAVVALWQTFIEAARASAERIDAERSIGAASEKVKGQMERFVSAGRLFRLRLTFALIPATVSVAVLILAGVENKVALVVVPVVFAVVGSFLPVMYYRVKVKRRQERFEAEILDLTVGIYNAIRAGMALPQALEKVSAQMTGPMKEELQIVLREYRLGVDIVRALDRLHSRMPCEDIRLLMCAVKLTTEAGGALAAVLAEMTAMIRGRREFADKVKALTAEGRFEAIAMSCAPVAAFCFLHLIQAELMRPLYTTGIGWITLGAVLTLVLAGYYFIRRIVSIEV